MLSEPSSDSSPPKPGDSDSAKVASDYIGYRVDPSPFPNPLKEIAFCTSPLIDGDSAGPINSNNEGTIYRVKNPVEEDLCIDVYPFTFKKPGYFNTTQVNLLNALTNFCYQKSSNNRTYTNFAPCMAMYNFCASNLLNSVKDFKKAVPNMTVPIDDATECHKITSLYFDDVNLLPEKDCAQLSDKLQTVCNYCKSSSISRRYLGQDCNSALKACINGTSDSMKVEDTTISCAAAKSIWTSS